MKYLLLLCLSLNVFASDSKIYNYKLSGARGGEVKFIDYKKKPFLLVNIATKCGYTKQLDDLEKLYKKYNAKGFTIIGIPSNDFGSQTPENNEEVAEFCRLNYGVTFPLTAKTIVKGDSKHPLVKLMLSEAGVENIKWNFEKFLYDKDGKFVARFESSTKPLDSDLEKAIQAIVK